MAQICKIGLAKRAEDPHPPLHPAPLRGAGTRPGRRGDCALTSNLLVMGEGKAGCFSMRVARYYHQLPLISSYKVPRRVKDREVANDPLIRELGSLWRNVRSSCNALLFDPPLKGG